MALFNPAPLRKRIAFDLGGEGVGASANAPLEDYGQASQAGSNATRALSALRGSQLDAWSAAAASDRANESLAIQRANAAAERAFRQQQADQAQQNRERAFGMQEANMALNNQWRQDQLANQRVIADDRNAASKFTQTMKSLDATERNAIGAGQKDIANQMAIARGMIGKGYIPSDVQTYMETGDASAIRPLPQKPEKPVRPFDPMAEMGKYRSASPKEDYGIFLERAKSSGDKKYTTLSPLWGRVFDEKAAQKGYLDYLTDYDRKANDYVSQRESEYNQTYAPQRALPIAQASAPQSTPSDQSKADALFTPANLEAYPEIRQVMPAGYQSKALPGITSAQPYQPVTSPALALPGNAAVNRVMGMNDQRNALIQRAMRDHGYSPEAAAAAVDEYLARKGGL